MKLLQKVFRRYRPVEPEDPEQCRTLHHTMTTLEKKVSQQEARLRAMQAEADVLRRRPQKGRDQ